MLDYLTEPATMTADAIWAELTVHAAAPMCHAISHPEHPHAACVHLGGQADISFRGDTLDGALRDALTAWRKAEVGYTRRRGLLPDSLAGLTVDAIRMAIDAAMALRPIETP